MEITDTSGIITGAASGIGRATAILLASEGARNLTLLDIDEHGLAETAALAGEHGCNVTTRTTDVADLDALQSAFKDAEAASGKIDFVFNNAGLLCGEATPWPDIDLTRVRTVVGVNLLAVLYGTELGARMMRGTGGGVVINTASVAAFGPMPPDPVYSATKMAIYNATASSAPLSDSHRVRVNCVFPGVVETAILKEASFTDAMDNKLDPMDIAKAVKALIEDDARAGQALVVNNPPAAGGEPEWVYLKDMSDYFRYASQRMAVP